jgi:hypothetical protein
MLWSSETVGYSIRYAYKVEQPDGSVRIILATDRRLGGWNNLWKPVSGTVSPTEDYRFSVIELRLNKLGMGEGKVSLAGPIAIDSSTQSIDVDNYAGAPVVLKAVKRIGGN